MKFTKRILPEFVLLDYIVPVIILIGIAIVLFVNVIPLGTPKVAGARVTFYAMTEGLDNYYEFKTAWRPRLFSTGLAAWTVNVSTELLSNKKSFLSAHTPLELAVALWTVSWFALGALILVYFLKRRSLFYIFGIFACISFGYMTIVRASYALRLYPWDLPSLFFFTIFVLLFIKKKYLWLLFIIPLGVGFKESIMILCVAFLLADLPWRQRLYLFFIAGVLSLGMKIILDFVVHAPIFFTMETGSEQNTYRSYNLSSFKTIIPFFINAGTLLAFYLLPSSGNKNITALKLISIPFILGNLLFGVLTEYRIWFEVIPFALYAIDVKIYGDPLAEAPIVV